MSDLIIPGRGRIRLGNTTTYFHGGFPGLKPGELVLPASYTGHPRAIDFVDDPQKDLVRRDRVYLTTDAAGASIYAAFYPKPPGWLYVVDPIGELEPDPDCTQPGLSFQTTKARVLEGRPLTEPEIDLIRRTILGSPS